MTDANVRESLLDLGNGNGGHGAAGSNLAKWLGAQVEQREFLRRLLDYEIRGALRYRRFLSLVVLESTDDDPPFQALADVFRTSDEWLRYEPRRVAIVMRETAEDAALIAVQRALATGGLTGAFRVAVAAYPADGCNGSELIRLAEERLNHRPLGDAAPAAGVWTPGNEGEQRDERAIG